MGKSFGILMQTSPYLIARAIAYLVFGLINLVWLGLMIGLLVLLANTGGIIVFIILVIGIGGVIGLFKLAERAVFYAIKAGHVAVITELVTKGSLPPGVNQVQYGKDVVTKKFGTMAAFAVADALIEGAVRQVLGWLTMAANLLGFIPGINTVWSIVRQVLSTAGNYIDEAVLSFTLAHPEQNTWKSAADGVVLYAQSWKKLIMTAAVVVLIIWAIFIVGALPFFAIGMAIGGALAGADVAWIAGLILGGIGGGIVRAILADPLATVMMVVAYNDAIRDQQPEVDLYGKLSGVSKKFRELNDRAQQPQPVPMPVAAGPR